MVIVGASAAGLRCAARLARLCPELTVTVIEQSERFSYAACGLPYVLSGDVDDSEELLRTVYGVLRDTAYFATVKGVDVRGGWRATEVDPEARTVTIQRGEQVQRLEWDELVLATGARPRRLPIQPDHPRVQSFHVLEDLKPLQSGLIRGEIDHAVIIGAGLVGCELAEAFHALWGADVTLLEAADWTLPQVLDREMAAAVGAALSAEGVTVHTGVAVSAIEADDDGVRVTAGDLAVAGDVAVVAVGVEPEVSLAVQAGAILGPTGAIAVNERMATSVPHVWAAGDCVEVAHAVTGRPAFLPLGSLANRQGRVLANVLAGREGAFPAPAGAVAVKVFDLNVAAVGCTAEQAAQSGRAARSAWMTGTDRAHYYPENEIIHLKVVYEPESHVVIGVQAVGEGEVAKRVDVATAVIARGGTLEDLADIEHAYAPPYAPAVDPLAVLAWTALNQEDRGAVAVPPDVAVDGHRLIDVREAEEIEAAPTDFDVDWTVPVSEVRQRLAELPDDVLVVCERGTRSAEVVRWLTSRGRRASYLGGGMQLRRRR